MIYQPNHHKIVHYYTVIYSTLSATHCVHSKYNHYAAVHYTADHVYKMFNVIYIYSQFKSKNTHGKSIYGYSKLSLQINLSFRPKEGRNVVTQN